jgi:hypothetical protein
MWEDRVDGTYLKHSLHPCLEQQSFAQGQKLEWVSLRQLWRRHRTFLLVPIFSPSPIVPPVLPTLPVSHFACWHFAANRSHRLGILATGTRRAWVLRLGALGGGVDCGTDEWTRKAATARAGRAPVREASHMCRSGACGWSTGRVRRRPRRCGHDNERFLAAGSSALLAKDMVPEAALTGRRV